MDDVRQGLARLDAAAADGSLTRLCQDHDAGLLLVFGSVLDDTRTPRDLDLAAGFEPYRPAAVLPLLDALMELAGTSAVDLMVLNTAEPVAREQALVHGRLLVELVPCTAAEAQITATMQRLDTDHLQRLELDLLRGSR